MCQNHDLCTCPTGRENKDTKDTSDKDSPNGIILNYSVHISETYFGLPRNEFLDWIDRQLTTMHEQLWNKAGEHWDEREYDKTHPTEFTGL